MRQLTASALATVAVAVLLTIIICAANSLAQDDPQVAVDPEMAAAIAARERAQATIDSLLATQTLERVQAAADTLYPALLAAGVQLRPHRADPLYVEIVVPFSRASEAGQLMWREARVAALASGARLYELPGDDWAWSVHQVNVPTVLGALAGVVTPTPSQEE